MVVIFILPSLLVACENLSEVMAKVRQKFSTSKEVREFASLQKLSAVRRTQPIRFNYISDHVRFLIRNDKW